MIKIGDNLDNYSLDAVKKFNNDALHAAYSI